MCVCVQVESTLAPETAVSQQRRGSDVAQMTGDTEDKVKMPWLPFMVFSSFYQCVLNCLLSLVKAAAPRPLPPPPTLRVDLEGRKRSAEDRNAVAATTSSSVGSCNDEFLPQKVVRKLPAPQCNEKGMRLCHLEFVQ